MSKKVINKATTREQKLYQRDKNRIAEYYTQSIKENAKVIDIQLNLHGYTNLKNDQKLILLNLFLSLYTIRYAPLFI